LNVVNIRAFLVVDDRRSQTRGRGCADAMARAYTTATAFGEEERYDLRLQRRNRKRLSVAAGSCALVSLFFIAWVFHHSWNIAFRDDAPSNAEEAVLKRATMLALAQQHQADDGAGGDPALRLETREDAREDALRLERGGRSEMSETRTVGGRETSIDAPRAPSHGAYRDVHVRVHVVVESLKFHTTELLLVKDPDTKTWGPLLSGAKTSAPRRADYKTLTSDRPVTDAAAAVLFQRLGLGQPPDIEFMQGIPATGHDDDGDADDGDDAAFVVVVRDENVLDDEDGYMLHAGAGAGFGGFGSGGDSVGKGKADEARDEMLATRRVPLRSALSGGASVGKRHALRYDVKSLRVFLEPWVLTDGKDPKAACRDPRVAAARAAGDEAEAEAIFAALPRDERTRPMTLEEKIHG
jgi:hypothetical protein